MVFKEYVNIEVTGLIECKTTKDFQRVKKICCEIDQDRHIIGDKVYYIPIKEINDFKLTVKTLEIESNINGVRVTLSTTCNKVDALEYIEEAHNILKNIAGE